MKFQVNILSSLEIINIKRCFSYYKNVYLSEIKQKLSHQREPYSIDKLGNIKSELDDARVLQFLCNIVIRIPKNGKSQQRIGNPKIKLDYRDGVTGTFIFSIPYY